MAKNENLKKILNVWPILDVLLVNMKMLKKNYNMIQVTFLLLTL